MRRSLPKNRTALVLSLAAWALAPQPGAAQVTDPDALALFTPEVARCLETGAPADCDPHRLALTACAQDPVAEICAPLLATPDTTLADPQALEKLRSTLAEFARSEVTEAAPASPDADPAIRLEKPNRAEKRAAQPDPTEAPKARPKRDPAAQSETAGPDDAAAPATTADAPKPRPKRDASTEANSARAEPKLRKQRAPEADAEAEEADRLLREAESTKAAPTSDPEMVEEVITETAPRPPEPAVPDLSTRDRARIEELSRQPEVANALDVLGAAADRKDTAITAPKKTAPAEIVEEAIAPDAIRRSTEDFALRLSLQPETAPAPEGRSRRERDLERAGLAALGALAIGMMVNDHRVVARADDRVILQGQDGALQVWRDDDAILQSDGGTRRIERYADGTTVSEWRRQDGSRVLTLRDATGRVLSRERVLADGTIVPLFDEAARVEPVDVSTLPDMRYRELRLVAGTDPDRALVLLDQAEADARAVDRSFTLRQIRELRPVRELVPVLSPDPITFQTGQANIRADEVPKLLQVGRVIERLIERNPSELFLIEGHTDAVGAAAYNLGLSDRRAESVALALTEFFAIPPENLTVQGYGENYLRVSTDLSEERNRRVVMRRITPLLSH